MRIVVIVVVATVIGPGARLPSFVRLGFSFFLWRGSRRYPEERCVG